MHTSSFILPLILPLLSAANPISPEARSSTCPTIFTLTASAADGNTSASYNGLSVIENDSAFYLAEKSKYLFLGLEPIVTVTFYQNDTSSLWATGFDIQVAAPPYPSQVKYPPPFAVIIDEYGFTHLDTDPPTSSLCNIYGCEYFEFTQFTQDGGVLMYESVDGGVGGWWACPEGEDGIWNLYTGVAGFGDGSGCDEVELTMVTQKATSADVC